MHGAQSMSGHMSVLFRGIRPTSTFTSKWMLHDHWTALLNYDHAAPNIVDLPVSYASSTLADGHP